MKYSNPTKNNGRLESVEIYEGESIETKCARVLESGEPITDTAPIIYTAKEPLGSLAGRGSEGRRKGGRGLRIKCEEPSLIMVLESYVPRVDYSQGSKCYRDWETSGGHDCKR